MLIQFYPHLTHLQRAPAAGQYFCAGYPDIKILPNPPGKAHVSIGTGRIKQGTNPSSTEQGWKSHIQRMCKELHDSCFPGIHGSPQPRPGASPCGMELGRCSRCPKGIAQSLQSSSAWLSLEQIAAKPGSGCFVLCEFQQGIHILHTAYGNNKAAVGIFFPVFSQ